MTDQLQCWRCGASLAALRLPIGRTEECAACRSQLHVCRLCRSYDRTRPKQCREEDAEEHDRPQLGAGEVRFAAHTWKSSGLNESRCFASIASLTFSTVAADS